LEFFEDHRLELYNLRDDISEQHNLAASQPEKTKELHAKMVAWREAIHAPMPTPNTEQREAPKRGKRKAAAEE
jgi:hypothetical protein